ncbi:cobyric acid synthase [Piscinibacter sakaiensis]|nr:cobyric acid synthase [Piscinibacter sakaiensis]
MVFGTTSGAGKSWLATALCRWYARQGLRVAPFKAQNMSNNARVVAGPDGVAGEIGSAQYFQALAAGVAPEVRMNPVLLKPERDTASQLVCWGQVDRRLGALPWHARSAAVWPLAHEALRQLAAEHELIVIEGAGSPAEINLAGTDFVNLHTARAARAQGLLVTDIDRGGAFAHLYGTQRLMPPDVAARLRGFVLNRFRGDPALLAPGPARLEALTGVPTVAVLPLWREHGLPEEDGVVDDLPPAAAPRDGARWIGVLAPPSLSNLDEFQALRRLSGVRLRWVREPRALDGVHTVILPGSKQTLADLAWLRARGLDEAVQAHARAGGAVLGICGGLQMLGQRIEDPDGLEQPGGGAVDGLGLLPLVTHFAAPKRLRAVQAAFGAEGPQRPDGAWAALAGQSCAVYDIHHGRTAPAPAIDIAPALRTVLRDAVGEALGWQCGPVLGLRCHGLFEAPAVQQALFGAALPPLDTVFDGLADLVDRHFAPGVLAALA